MISFSSFFFWFYFFLLLYFLLFLYFYYILLLCELLSLYSYRPAVLQMNGENFALYNFLLSSSGNRKLWLWLQLRWSEWKEGGGRLPSISHRVVRCSHKAQTGHPAEPERWWNSQIRSVHQVRSSQYSISLHHCFLKLSGFIALKHVRCVISRLAD